jgi:outer membrane protein assembly factor BamA
MRPAPLFLLLTRHVAFALATVIASPALSQDVADTDPIDAESELERVGATIREIRIAVDNVFDPSKPDEDKKLYHFANHIHVRTRPEVIEHALLFKQGDRYNRRVIDETARALRARGFLSEAIIEHRDYDPSTNSVAVEVRVRDSWTLAPDLTFSHSGGESEWGAGIEDRNLLGTGKMINLSYKSTVDRDEARISYNDPNVFGSRVRLFSSLGDATDGHRVQVAAERPFYALDTRWMLGGSVHDEERIDPMYDLGEEVDEFDHDLQSITLQGGWSRGIVNGFAKRWIFGITSEEDTFNPTVDKPQPIFLPENRKLVYPWIGWQLLQDDYREMTKLNDMGRTEDVALGMGLYFSVGFADTSFGSDRDAILYRVTAQNGWEPAEGHLLLVSANATARQEDDGLENSIVQANARYYMRQTENRLLTLALGVTSGNNLDGDKQVLLGGDNGLRGYPQRYQAGEQSVIFTAEERFFTELYPWRLFRVGWAAFFDVGRVSGPDPRASPSLGTLADVGIGLRLSSPRASGKSVVHVDLAFPLNGDESIDSVQLVVETKASF